jgi:hypothetical protein
MIGCMVLMGIMFGASLMFAPFIHNDEDRLDVTTRVANISNVVIALMLLHKWGGEAGNAIANGVLFSVNIVTLIYAIKVLNPIDLYRAARQAIAEVKIQRDIEAAKRAELKVKASARLFRAAKEGNIAEVEEIFLDDADVDWQNLPTTEITESPSTESEVGRESETGRESEGNKTTKAPDLAGDIALEEIGWTACHACAHEGGDAHVTILKNLVRRLADLGIMGGAPVATTASGSLSQQADNNEFADPPQQSIGRRALHEAWAAGSFQAVTVLMDAGADANALCRGADGMLLTPAECFPQPSPIQLPAPVLRATPKMENGDTMYVVSVNEVGRHWWLRSELVETDGSDNPVLDDALDFQIDNHNKPQEQMVERMVQHGRLLDLRAAGNSGLKVTKAMIETVGTLHGERMYPDLIRCATDLDVPRTLSDASQRAVILALEEHRSLTGLWFGYMDISATNMTALIRILPTINPGGLIRFAPPAISKASDVKRLVAGLEPHQQFIQHLDYDGLRNCKNLALVPLFISLRHFVSLKSINLDSVGLGIDSMNALVQNLPATLEALYFNCCDKVQEGGWLALADSLRDNCPVLRELDLGGIGKETYDFGSIGVDLEETKSKLQKAVASADEAELTAKVEALTEKAKAALRLTSAALTRLLCRLPDGIEYLKLSDVEGLNDQVTAQSFFDPSTYMHTRTYRTKWYRWDYQFQILLAMYNPPLTHQLSILFYLRRWRLNSAMP